MILLVFYYRATRGREGKISILKEYGAGKGFEKLDVQKEIKSLRKDISKSIS
jgi:hypothetical protein